MNPVWDPVAIEVTGRDRWSCARAPWTETSRYAGATVGLGNMNRPRSFARRPTVPHGPREVFAARRGMYAQGVCVLLDRPVAVGSLGPHLAGFDVLKELPAADGPYGWALAGPSLLMPYRPDVNGFVQVDVVAQPWPDGMGAPGDDTAPLLAAWSMGHFGPCTFPGALRSAMQHDRSSEAASRHRAFLRIRLSYAFGAKAGPVQPDDADMLDELRFVSQIQAALLRAPNALCAFNPNGHLLLTRERLEAILERDLDGGGLSVDAWANVRTFRPDGLGWTLFDTVGMEQVGVVDHEAAVPSDHPSAAHARGLLYTMAAYDADLGGVLGPSDTATDLGGCNWRAHGDGDALVAPPRPVLRWAPEGLAVPPALAPASRDRASP